MLQKKKINLRGVPVIFLDTAGIRNARNLVEKEGIKKAKTAIKDADIVLKILDISKLKAKNETEDCKKKNWIVLNKIDISKKEKNPKNQQNENTFFVSAKTGKGIKELLNKIHQHILNEINDKERGEYYFTNERQKIDLKKALANLQAAIREKDEEIVAEYLRAASGNLERILGKIDIEEVLGQIFSSFCIGK